MYGCAFSSSAIAKFPAAIIVVTITSASVIHITDDHTFDSHLGWTEPPLICTLLLFLADTVLSAENMAMCWLRLNESDAECVGNTGETENEDRLGESLAEYWDTHRLSESVAPSTN